MVSIRAVVLLLTCVLFHPLAASAEPPAAPAPPDPHAAGRRLFLRDCASCHGRDARGDGPDAALFAPPPPALTGASLRRQPTAALVARITGDRTRSLTLDPAALRRRATDVEAIAAHLERLPTVHWRTVERGQEIYVDRCEICHGPYGRPQGNAPPGVGTPRDLSEPLTQRLDDAEIIEAMRQGHRAMPALVPVVPPEDARATAAFVRLLSPGFERYTRYCAACHGDDGRGTGSFAESGSLPSVVFDRAYFRRHDAEQVRTAVWHMLDAQAPGMPHLRRRLTAAQAEAIVAYLRARD
jgi:mono/diheme cytochrome c family protein